MTGIFNAHAGLRIEPAIPAHCFDAADHAVLESMGFDIDPMSREIQLQQVGEHLAFGVHGMTGLRETITVDGPIRHPGRVIEALHARFAPEQNRRTAGPGALGGEETPRWAQWLHEYSHSWDPEDSIELDVSPLGYFMDLLGKPAVAQAGINRFDITMIGLAQTDNGVKPVAHHFVVTPDGAGAANTDTLVGAAEHSIDAGVAVPAGDASTGEDRDRVGFALHAVRNYTTDDLRHDAPQQQTQALRNMVDQVEQGERADELGQTQEWRKELDDCAAEAAQYAYSDEEQDVPEESGAPGTV